MAEEKKEEGEGKEGEEQPKPKSKKKLIIIGAAVGVLAIGGGAFAFLGGGKPPPEEGAQEQVEEETHLATAELDTFIVNLSESASFLKIKIMIEYDPAVIAKTTGGHDGGSEGGEGHGEGAAGDAGAAKGGLPPALGERLPMIRDAVLHVLSSKKAEEVLSPEGKEQLKEELIEAINEATGLDEGPVVQVYFLEFLIQ